jgi:hypothetical protein
MHFTPTVALEVILMLPPLGIYIEGEATQATYRLNCCGEFTRARFCHSVVLKKMGHQIVLIIAFERRFSVELSPRSSWLS